LAHNPRSFSASEDENNVDEGHDDDEEEEEEEKKKKNGVCHIDRHPQQPATFWWALSCCPPNSVIYTCKGDQEERSVKHHI